MHNIYLDTNFIIKTIEWKIDLFGELDRICHFKFEVVLLDKVLNELADYGAEGGKKKETASVALLVLSKNKVKNVPAEGTGTVDDVLVKMAKKGDSVATQDQELKRRLKEKGVPAIVIREKGYLEFLGD
jgi:hypothetical protein